MKTCMMENCDLGENKLYSIFTAPFYITCCFSNIIPTRELCITYKDKQRNLYSIRIKYISTETEFCKK